MSSEVAVDRKSNAALDGNDVAGTAPVICTGTTIGLSDMAVTHVAAVRS